MPDDMKQVNFRASRYTLRTLAALAEAWGSSRSEALRTCITLAAEREAATMGRQVIGGGGRDDSAD